jgi:predicted transcriptional regulator
MTVQEIIERLGLGVLSGTNLSQEITGGYASDLLSCVMAKARAGNVWVTLQAHPNVVAVASLLDLAAVIVTEGVAPDAETIRKAQEEGIALLTTPNTTFAVVGSLTELGVRGTSSG